MERQLQKGKQCSSAMVETIQLKQISIVHTKKTTADPEGFILVGYNTQLLPFLNPLDPLTVYFMNCEAPSTIQYYTNLCHVAILKNMYCNSNIAVLHPHVLFE